MGFIAEIAKSIAATVIGALVLETLGYPVLDSLGTASNIVEWLIGVFLFL